MKFMTSYNAIFLDYIGFDAVYGWLNTLEQRAHIHTHTSRYVDLFILYENQLLNSCVL